MEQKQTLLQTDWVEEVKILFYKPLASNQTKGATSNNKTEDKKKENFPGEKETNNTFGLRKLSRKYTVRFH